MGAGFSSMMFLSRASGMASLSTSTSRAGSEFESMRFEMHVQILWQAHARTARIAKLTKKMTRSVLAEAIGELTCFVSVVFARTGVSSVAEIFAVAVSFTSVSAYKHRIESTS